MKAVTYCGPFDEIEVLGRVIAQGETFDVSPDEVADALCTQSDFELAEKPVTKKGETR
jgi:hypothetical protein